VWRKPLFLMLALLRTVPLSEFVLFGSVQKALTLNTYCKYERVMQVKLNCRRRFNICDASPSRCVRSLGNNICGNWFFVRYYRRFCWQLVTTVHSFLHNSIRFCSFKIKRRGIWRRTVWPQRQVISLISLRSKLEKGKVFAVHAMKAYTRSRGMQDKQIVYSCVKHNSTISFPYFNGDMFWSFRPSSDPLTET
jgi:hypothetical protein